MSIEIRPIPSTGGRYGAGVDGRIYRIDRGAPRPLRPDMAGSRREYEYVAISIGGVARRHSVHRLVCEAFYGACPFPGGHVRHLDGNPQNNLPSNLDWGTVSQNRKDTVAHGRHDARRRLTVQQANDIRASAESTLNLARMYGLTKTAIRRIRLGLSYRDDLPAAPPPNFPRTTQE